MSLNPCCWRPATRCVARGELPRSGESGGSGACRSSSHWGGRRRRSEGLVGQYPNFLQRLSDLIGPCRSTYRIVYRVLQPLLVVKGVTTIDPRPREGSRARDTDLSARTALWCKVSQHVLVSQSPSQESSSVFIHFLYSRGSFWELSHLSLQKLSIN